MPFVTYLVVRPLDEKFWELQQDLVYEGNEDYFAVPAMHKTDFASVPRPFWWLVPRYGRYTEVAVLHDYLCDMARAGDFNRCDADGIFRRALREIGVGYIKRRIMWAAVRWGGGVAKCGFHQLLLVLMITLLALPLVIPAAVILVSLLIVWVVGLVT
jgi:hypothetical protein